MTAETSPSSVSPRRELLRRIFDATQSVTNPKVQANFRLVPPNHTATPDIEELISSRNGERYIAVLSEGEIAKRHAQLLEHRMPVLSGMYLPEGLLTLGVPSGTRSVAAYMNSIRRQPELYAEVFQEVGVVLGGVKRVFGKNLAPTEDYPLLRQFAAASNDESSSGGRVFLIPPYNVADSSRDQVLDTVRQELVGSQIVLPEQADYLLEQVNEGWTE